MASIRGRLAVSFARCVARSRRNSADPDEADALEEIDNEFNRLTIRLLIARAHDVQGRRQCRFADKDRVCGPH